MRTHFSMVLCGLLVKFWVHSLLTRHLFDLLSISFFNFLFLLSIMKIFWRYKLLINHRNFQFFNIFCVSYWEFYFIVFPIQCKSLFLLHLGWDLDWDLDWDCDLFWPLNLAKILSFCFLGFKKIHILLSSVEWRAAMRIQWNKCIGLSMVSKHRPSKSSKRVHLTHKRLKGTLSYIIISSSPPF